MGEIQIKSGNLCERYTSVGTAQQYSVSLYMFADIQPSTTYTIAFEIDEGSLQYFNENLFTYSQYYVTGTGNKQILQLNTKANIQKTASTWSDTYGWIIAKNYTGNATVPHWKKIQLLEGTYTSETIPEYQPYFLNRPAHQVTNGQWVDIPTHHYTNGRWQGELTSQSPLKFRADGEMLDWRVEGKTSQNLFDIGKNVNDYERTYQMISVDGSLISMKLEGSGMTFHYRTHNITTTGTVTIYCKGSKAKPQLFVRLRSMDDTKWLTNSDVTISGMAYNSVYNGWFSYAMDDTFIKTIIIPECLYWNMGVGFNSTAGTIGEIVTISNPMVISGTYTASTLPPYEPYGGVGDYDETAQRYKIPVNVNGVTTNLFTDHQLMEGDSIDYTTDQTSIPLATGNNVLTVDTAVQPKSVFVKFEG